MDARTQRSAEGEQEREKFDFLSGREGREAADDLLRGVLNTPPGPHTPKPKESRKPRASR